MVQSMGLQTTGQDLAAEQQQQQQWLIGKESACNLGDLGLIPGWGKSPGEGKGYPLQYSGLENSMDCIIHRVSNSRTRLSHFHFHFHKKQCKQKKKIAFKNC